jgi:hypothetical protein
MQLWLYLATTLGVYAMSASARLAAGAVAPAPQLCRYARLAAGAVAPTPYRGVFPRSTLTVCVMPLRAAGGRVPCHPAPRPGVAPLDPLMFVPWFRDSARLPLRAAGGRVPRHPAPRPGVAPLDPQGWGLAGS